MEYNQHDEVWKATWKSYYETYFQEMLSERLVLRWQRFDEVSKILITLTTSGSALSGWTLWEKPEFKFIWAIIAGIGAVLAIIHKSLDVTRKQTDWATSRSQFCLIRIDFEILLNQMSYDPDFSVKDFGDSCKNLHHKYGEAYQNIKTDPFITNRFEIKIQDKLNAIISNKY